MARHERHEPAAMKVGALVHMYPPLHNAGAEHYLHALLAPMAAAGHDVVVAVEPTPGCPDMTAPYTHDGVRVGPRSILKGAEVVITHLDRTPEAERYCRENGLPLVQIFHNHLRPRMARLCNLAVYNSFWIAEGHECRRAPEAMVIHPPIWPDNYRVERTGDAITLINLCPAKGVRLFYALAEAMPEVPFLGVKGAYGEQVPAPALRNLTIIETQKDVRKVYEKTRVLLMPSSYESYGRVAVEAAVSGIPTVAHPTDGLVEALGDAGTFVHHVTDRIAIREERQRKELSLNRLGAWISAVSSVLDDYEARSSAASNRISTLNPREDFERFALTLQHLTRGR